MRSWTLDSAPQAPKLLTCGPLLSVRDRTVRPGWYGSFSRRAEGPSLPFPERGARSSRTALGLRGTALRPAGSPAEAGAGFTKPGECLPPSISVSISWSRSRRPLPRMDRLEGGPSRLTRTCSLASRPYCGKSEGRRPAQALRAALSAPASDRVRYGRPHASWTRRQA